MMECPPNGFRSSKGETRLALESSEKATSKPWGWGVAGPKRRERQNAPPPASRGRENPGAAGAWAIGCAGPWCGLARREASDSSPAVQDARAGSGERERAEGRRAGPVGLWDRKSCVSGAGSAAARTQPRGHRLRAQEPFGFPPRPRYSGVPGNPAGKCGAAAGQRRPRLGPRVPEAPAAGPTTRAGSRPEPSAPPTQAACPCAGKRKRTN